MLLWVQFNYWSNYFNLYSAPILFMFLFKVSCNPVCLQPAMVQVMDLRPVAVLSREPYNLSRNGLANSLTNAKVAIYIVIWVRIDESFLQK